MDVNRAAAHELRVSPAPLPLADLLRDLVEDFGRAADERGIRLVLELPEALPDSFADPGRTRQVFSTLIDNALEFTPPGGGVRLVAHCDPLDAVFVEVAVADTGCGIAADSRERIFERMHQEHPAIRSSRWGLGLGLYLCRELVERQGGLIWVESWPGHGSTFRVRLPTLHTLRGEPPRAAAARRLEAS